MGETAKTWMAMDPDTFSGRLLEQYGLRGASYLFDAFHALNAGWIDDFVAPSCRRYVPPPDPAEVTAHIFCDIFHSADSYVFRGGPLFRRWVCVLSRNRLRKMVRAFHARFKGGACPLEEMDDKGMGDPLFKLICREERIRLLESWRLILAVCHLSLCRAEALEQEALRLQACEGLGYRQLAETLGIPAARIPCLMRRSRRRVARRMHAIFREVRKRALQARTG